MRGVLLAALLLAGSAFALDPQTITPAGTTAKNAQGVQGVTNGVALPVTVGAGSSFDVTDRVARALGHIICDSGCGGAASFGDNSVFTAGTTSVAITAGVFNDSIAALTSGSAGAPRLTSTRAIHFNMRTNAGVEVPFPAALDADLGFKVHIQNAVAVSWASAQHVIVDTAPSTAVTGTFWQLTQPVSIASMPTTAVTGTFWPTTAAAPASHELSDGAAFYTAAKTGQFPAALVGSRLDVNVGNTPAVTVTSGSVTATQATGTNLHAVLDTTSTTAVTQATGTNLHAVLDTTSTTAVTQATAASLNATATQGGTWTVTTAPPANASTNIAQMGGVTTSMNQGIPDTGTQRVTLAQGTTYQASTAAKTTTAAGITPFFAICGSATKTVRIQKIVVTGTVATAAVWGDVVLKKTSAATSAGTPTALTKVPLDSNSAASTANLVNFYTVLATAGTLVGSIDSRSQLFPVTAISATLQPSPSPLEFRWVDQDSEAPVLRGIAQCIEASFGTTPTNAPTLTVTVRWTEN